MQRTNIHLTDPQRAALQRLAAKTGLTAAEHVRRAVDAYITANDRRVMGKKGR